MPWSRTSAPWIEGIAYLDIAPPGRRLLVVAIDHMPSPITSSTSLWQDRPAPPYRPKMLAFFPGEISSVEDLPNHIILHPSDTRAGTSVY